MGDILRRAVQQLVFIGLVGLAGYSCVQPIDPPEGGSVKAPVVEEEIGYISIFPVWGPEPYYCVRNEFDDAWPVVIFEPEGGDWMSRLQCKLKERLVGKAEIKFLRGASLRVRIRRLPSYCICREMGDDPPFPIRSYPVMGQLPIVEVVEVLEE